MDWYEEDVKGAITERLHCAYEPETIFYGSSSIRLWNTLYKDFADYRPVNLGFGGSTLAACVCFFDRIAAPVSNPQKFILYAGDNDLGDGKHPEEVLFFFREFIKKLRQCFNEIPFYFISIKPSLSRMEILDKIALTNRLIEEEIYTETGNYNNHYINIFDKMIGTDGKPVAELFENDGLHLNTNGYLLWKNIILNECLLNN